MVFDPSYPDIVMDNFKECVWENFYKTAKEAIPGNVPDPRCKDIDLRVFVNSDHSGVIVTRRSRTGFFVFMNMSHIEWCSKK